MHGSESHASPSTPPYRGRFAPSPTGPLHFGSLIAALGSFLQARHQGGEWLVRIEDVDIPRTVEGAGDAILADLERLGLTWDGRVVYQSERAARYAQTLAALQHAGWTFACGCTRAELGGAIYPGTCREGLPPGKTLISGERGPLMVVVESGDRATVHTAFRMADSNIGLLPAFPQLLRRSLSRAYGEPARPRPEPPRLLSPAESELRHAAGQVRNRPLPEFGRDGSSLAVPVLLLGLLALAVRVYA